VAVAAADTLGFIDIHMILTIDTLPFSFLPAWQKWPGHFSSQPFTDPWEAVVVPNTLNLYLQPP
jgi:hypothetical protein